MVLCKVITRVLVAWKHAKYCQYAVGRANEEEKQALLSRGDLSKSTATGESPYERAHPLLFPQYIKIDLRSFSNMIENINVL